MIVPDPTVTTSEYRYGYQGSEKDNEVKGGDGKSINFTFRMHDPRLGRFFTIDPLSHKFAWNSPYAFSENRVIDGLELEGLEVVHFGIPGKIVGSIDFQKMDEKTIKQKILLYEKYHKGRVNFDNIKTRNDYEVWTIEALRTPYGQSTGVLISGYASEASYNKGSGKPFSEEYDRNFFESFVAKDREVGGDWKKGTAFGVSVIATIFSGGSLAAAKSAGQVLWSLTGLVFNVDDLTSLDGKTALEKTIAKKFGEQYGNIYNNAKVAFNLVDAEKSLYDLSITLENGTKIQKTYDALNNVVIRTNIIANPPEVKTEKDKKKKTNDE